MRHIQFFGKYICSLRGNIHFFQPKRASNLLKLKKNTYFSALKY